MHTPGGIVQNTQEFRRVAELPRRDWSTYPKTLVDDMTEVLRTPNGTQRLFPIQAVSLWELWQFGGLFGSIGVGEGKTLISLLAPVVVGAKRPLLILPKKLIYKTEQAEKQLAWHWKIPKNRRIVSVESLSRVGQKHYLEEYSPDLIVIDEAHRIKNHKAASTRRIVRYLKNNPDVPFVPLSGTFFRDNLLEVSHLLAMTQRRSNYLPIPRQWDELRDWSDALSREPKTDAGALLTLPGATIDDARPGFAKRLAETPGIIVTESSQSGLPSLLVRTNYPVTGPLPVDGTIETIEKTWDLPDGYALSVASQVWSSVRQAALGFFYRYVDPPPREYLDARRCWAHFVRDKAQYSQIDSEEEAARKFPESEEWLRWQEIKQRVGKLPREAVWIDSSILEYAAKWLLDSGQLVWIDYVEFGRKLSELTGVPFFNQSGATADGLSILDHKGPAICSIRSVGEGFDLQDRYSENLIVSPQKSVNVNEQLIARTHRRFQKKEEVTVDVLINCRIHFDALMTAFDEADHIKKLENRVCRLLYCDREIKSPADLGLSKGRWE